MNFKAPTLPEGPPGDQMTVPVNSAIWTGKHMIWSRFPESDPSLLDLVANGTLDAEIAATLWSIADERRSFMTVAIHRFRRDPQVRQS